MTTLIQTPAVETKTYWTADLNYSTLEFKVKHFMISSVSGKFTDFVLEVKTEGDDFRTGSVQLDVRVKSIQTGVELRDNHLKSKDFFAADEFPLITFLSTGVEAVSPTRFRVSGVLTIKNIAKPVTLDLEYSGKIIDAHGRERAGFSLETEINRFDFELNWNFALQNNAAIVGKNIKISADVVLVKESEPPKHTFQIDSMMAAYHTQQSQLPDINHFRKVFPNTFLIYQPRELVGGDFYWFEQLGDKMALIVADCTGHGMEGSMKTVMGVSFLNQIVREHPDVDSIQLVRRLHLAILDSVRKSVTKNSLMLAMDMSVCIFDPVRQTIEYLGANIPGYLLTQEGLRTLEANRLSVGSHLHSTDNLVAKKINYKQGDMLFIATDGVKDQYGGPYGKKLGARAMQERFVEQAARMDVREAERALYNAFFEWKGNFEQLDDVTIFGIRF